MKLGLKDTLTLRAMGYSKKDIEEMAAIDEAKENTPDPDPAQPDEDPEPETDPAEDEPDYKKLYEELKSQADKDKEDLKALQKKNTQENMSPDVDNAKKEQDALLISAINKFL